METISVRQLVECWKWSLQFVHAGVVSWGVTICPGVGSCGATIYPGAGSCGATICPSRGGRREGAVCLWISLSSCNSPLQLFFFISRVYTGGPKTPDTWIGSLKANLHRAGYRCIFEFSSNIFFTHILYIYDIFFRCRIFFVFYFSVSSFLFPFSLLSIWCKCKNSCSIYSTALIFSNIGLFKMSLTFSLKGQYSVKLIWGNAMDTRISNLQ